MTHPPTGSTGRTAEFINPYTFVPLPSTINRARPVGHHRAVAGNLSGWLSVRWTVRTPLLLPRTGGVPVRDGRVVIPGSSVKGALRSLHETVMGGCLRVVDEQFVPVYREPAVTRSGTWRLARVVQATERGRPTRVAVTTETAWVRIDLAQVALGRPPRTGDTLALSDLGEANSLGRRECTYPDQVAAGEEWVLLVGDSGARTNARAFFCAAGRLPTSGTDHLVVPEAWDDYVDLCQDSNDMRLIRAYPDRYPGWTNQRLFGEVRWPDETVVGSRRRVTGRLWTGDVVWVRVAEGDQGAGRRAVDRLSMAALWRTHGGGELGERIPPAVYACDHRDGTLCVSCRLFGAADTDGDLPGGRADQRSYAGHLRIGDAVADRVRTQRVQRLAPMGAPRPGAGQFYLAVANTEPAGSDEEMPTARWGSAHDDPGLRLVRGRKFYWNGDPRVQHPPRHEARQGHRNDKMTGPADVVPVDTVLRQRIAFDNVPPAELASLLVTLLPQLTLPPGQARDKPGFLLRLGGGKPLGLGSCSVEVGEFTVWDAVGRYRGDPPTVQTPEAFVTKQMLYGVAGLAGRAVLSHWPTLRRILRDDAVDPALIWYPLGDEWGARGQDRSFRFFAETDGRYLAKGGVPIVPLPDPADAEHSQALPLPRRKAARQQGRGRARGGEQ